MKREELTCERCGTKWTRDVTRGHKPKLCNTCRAPASKPVKPVKPVKVPRKRGTATAAPVTGKALTDRLEAALKARGTHLSQPNKYADRNYSLVSILDRIENLEREVEKLKEG